MMRSEGFLSGFDGRNRQSVPITLFCRGRTDADDTEEGIMSGTCEIVRSLRFTFRYDCGK